MTSYPSKFPHTQYGLTFGSRADWVQFLKAKAESVAASKGIPRGLMGGVIEQESSWGAGAINKNKNGSSDAGLTQINSTNWPSYGIKSADELVRDPLKSIEIGADILAKNLKARNGDVVLAVADYNQGPGATNSQISSKKPPSMPVQKYVTNVMFRASKYGGAFPTNGQIQEIESRLGFKPDVAGSAKAAGVDPRMVGDVTTVVEAAVTPNVALTLPSVQTQDDAAYEQDIARLDAGALQAQAAVENDLALAADAESLQIAETPPPVASPLPMANQDLTLTEIEETLPTPAQDMSIDDRITAAFGAAPKSLDDSQLPNFVDSVVDDVLKN